MIRPPMGGISKERLRSVSCPALSPKDQLELVENGWTIHGGLARPFARHPALVWPWPLYDALALVRETKRGPCELIHRMLKGA